MTRYVSALLNLLEQEVHETVEWIDWWGLNRVVPTLAETLTGLAVTLPAKHVRFRCLTPETLLNALPKNPKALLSTQGLVRAEQAIYAIGIIAETTGLGPAWKERIAQRAAERGVTGDLADPAVQATVIQTHA